MVKFSQFIENPNQATFDGYTPCFGDVISMWCCLVNKESILNVLDEWSFLLDCKIKNLPVELIKILIVTICFISIPFGGFIVFSMLSWLFTYRPGVLVDRVEQRRLHMKRKFNEL